MNSRPEDAGYVFQAQEFIWSAISLHTPPLQNIHHSVFFLGPLSDCVYALHAHDFNASDLQDNFTAQWDHATIAEVVRPYVVDNKITTVRHMAVTRASVSPSHVRVRHS